MGCINFLPDLHIGTGVCFNNHLSIFAVCIWNMTLFSFSKLYFLKVILLWILVFHGWCLISSPTIRLIFVTILKKNQEKLLAIICFILLQADATQLPLTSPLCLSTWGWRKISHLLWKTPEDGELLNH